MRLAGKSRRAKIAGENATGGVSNYYRTNDRRNWFEGIPQYARVRYRRVYSGIDLVFHGRDGHLEYDFEVAPKASVSDIRLDFSGAQSLVLAADGSLAMKAGDQTITFLAPVAYQFSSGERTNVPVHFCLDDPHHVTFDVGEYDRRRQLIIDPVVEYTYVLGVNSTTDVQAIAVNSAGELLLTGRTQASNYPNTGNAVSSSWAFYLTKLNASGTGIVFSTVLAMGAGHAITLDNAGNAYVAGEASEPGFPTTISSIANCTTCYSGFAAKFDTSGKLVYSTLLSSGQDIPYAMAVTGTGEVVLAGQSSGSLATVNAYADCASRPYSPFLAKLNTSATAYEFATCFGTSGTSRSLGIDSLGNIYLAGGGFVPMVNPLESVGSSFISEFSPDGQRLLASTYFDGAGSLVIGSDDTIYVAGAAGTNDFPYTLDAYRLPIDQPTQAGLPMFAAGFSPGLGSLKFSTYLGGGTVNAMTIDSSDHIYIAGQAGFASFPLKNAVVSDIVNGGFVIALDSTGQLTQSTEFGGRNSRQVPTAIAVDNNSGIYIAGVPSVYQPSNLSNALDQVNVGTGTAYSNQSALGTNVSFPSAGGVTFAAKISPSTAPQVSLTYDEPYLVLRNAGSADLAISNITWKGSALTGGDCGATVAAGTSCVLTIPQAGAGQLLITSNASPATQSFNPFPIATNTVWFDQRTVPYFPPQQVNTSSAPQAIEIVNVQTTAQPISSVGANGDFSQTNDCPSSLAAGAHCTIMVTFHPTVAHPYSSVYFASGQFTSFILLSDAGSPSSSAMALSTSAFDFNRIAVGKTSLLRTVNIHNASATMLAAPTASASGDATFSVAGSTCTNALAPHDNCAVAVLYKPVGNGNSAGILTITSGGDSSQVQLNGTGYIDSAVTISPLQLAPAAIAVNLHANLGSITLTNTSATPVSVTGIQFGLADYSETDTCQLSLAPGGTCTIAVGVTPQQLGDRSTLMTIHFDKAVTQKLSIALTGVFPITVYSSSLNFSTAILVGSYSSQQNLTFANTEFGPINYSLSVTGDFALQNNCANPVPVNSGCNIPVIFHPKKAGPAQGTITISIPGIAPVYQIPLTATAYDFSISPARPARPVRNVSASNTNSPRGTSQAARNLTPVRVVPTSVPASRRAATRIRLRAEKIAGTLAKN